MSNPQNINFNVQPDTPDLRDRMYHPTLRGLENTFNAQPFADPAAQARVKNQHKTSACTGFALAAMIEGLVYNGWNRNVQQGAGPREISPFMLYYFARRYDELPGSSVDDGSTARGAMKAWHKHGACRTEHWSDRNLNSKASGTEWIEDAFRTPLGAYYRVDHTSIPDIHAAINETGFVYATAQIHSGWDLNKGEGFITFDNSQKPWGGHAFLFVGYDEEGFWVQNSWGDTWGSKGFARLSYRDWRENSMDAWVAQLGVHISQQISTLANGLHYEPAAARSMDSPAAVLSANANLSAQQINPYIINVGNDGELSDSGQFATRPEDLHDMLSFYLPKAMQEWQIQDHQFIDIAIYVHGGLNNEEAAANTARRWIPALFNNRIFPVFLMWETGFLDTLKNILGEARASSSAASANGFWSKMAEQIEGWWNERLENAVSKPGTQIWEEMKENGERATTSRKGGLQLLYQELRKTAYNSIRSRLRFHLIGHSAGAHVHAFLAEALVGAGLKVDGLYFMAPACRRELFEQKLLPLYKQGKIAAYTQFHLTDVIEKRDTCGEIYRQSLLYLVSNAFERQRGRPILGMEKFAGPVIAARPARASVWDFIASPVKSADPTRQSNSTSHGGFDNDDDTELAILTRINQRRVNPAAGPAHAVKAAAKKAAGKKAAAKAPKKAAAKKTLAGRE